MSLAWSKRKILIIMKMNLVLSAMNSAMPEALDTNPFADSDLWQLGAVTELKYRLLIDDIRRRFDSSKDSWGHTILGVILRTNAADKRRMADVADLVLSLGVHPDLASVRLWRPSHVVGGRALVELVPTIFACRPDMAAVNGNDCTPLEASQSTYVSKKRNSEHPFCFKCR